MRKQVIVARKDLKLSRGKLSVSVAHASLESYKRSPESDREPWEREGSKKIALRAESLERMLEIFQSCKKAGLPCALIKDAGRTEVSPGTVTALGIGPAEEGEIDRITGKLGML